MQRKKLFICVICFILTLCALCGCMSYANDTHYSGKIDIPENGIVKKAVFESIKSSGGIAVFCGKCDSLSYNWTVFGSEIKEPGDTDLSIKVTSLPDERLIVLLNTKTAFSFTPVLSLTLNETWHSATATVTSEKGDVLCGAKLTNSENTIVNFTITDGIFTYNIKGDGNTDDAAHSDSAAPTGGILPEDGYLSSPAPVPTQDKYKTDPVPSDIPQPVEPGSVEIDKEKTYQCTIAIDCMTILNNLDKLAPEKADILPRDGIILPATTVTFCEGESVFDVLQRVCKDKRIHLEASFVPVYNTAYIEGIANLYELDCGSLSGWCYRVNGKYPNYGCSRYVLSDGDYIEFRYTCDLGNDIGGKMQS